MMSVSDNKFIFDSPCSSTSTTTGKRSPGRMPCPPMPAFRALQQSDMPPMMRLPVMSNKQVLLPSFDEEDLMVIDQPGRWKLQPRQSKAAAAMMLSLTDELEDEQPRSSSPRLRRWNLKPRRAVRKSKDLQGDGPPSLPMSLDGSDTESENGDDSELLAIFDAFQVGKKPRLEQPRVNLPLAQKATPTTFHALSA